MEQGYSMNNLDSTFVPLAEAGSNSNRVTPIGVAKLEITFLPNYRCYDRNSEESSPCLLKFNVQRSTVVRDYTLLAGRCYSSSFPDYAECGCRVCRRCFNVRTDADYLSCGEMDYEEGISERTVPHRVLYPMGSTHWQAVFPSADSTRTW